MPVRNFQTQAIYDLKVFETFMNKASKLNVPIQVMKAAEMRGRFLAQIKTMAQGVHLMPLGWANIVPNIPQTARVAI